LFFAFVSFVLRTARERRFLQESSAGASVAEDRQFEPVVQDVVGGKLIASAKDVEGNIIGLIQSP
jgi:hypothetical protein